MSFKLCLVLGVLMAVVAVVSADCGEHKDGDKWVTGPPEICARWACKGEVLSKVRCSEVILAEGCTQKEGDQSAKYPDCCPTAVCAD